MSHVLILADADLAGPAELESQLAALLGARGKVKACPDFPTLSEDLLRASQALIWFSGDQQKTVALLDKCRAVLPGAVLVNLLAENFAPDQLDALSCFDTACHYLQRPLQPQALLNTLAAGLREGELLTTLADSGRVDEVTNLLNRRYFLQRLSEEISIARRHMSPFCCVVIGINLYQMYLDSYGYSFVNALLRFLAERITGMVRHEDVVARLGDNELSILLVRSTEQGAKTFINRLIRKLNTLSFKYGAYEETVAVMAGLAGYPLPDLAVSDADTVVRYARHALHQAKLAEDEDHKVQLFSEIRLTF